MTQTTRGSIAAVVGIVLALLALIGPLHGHMEQWVFVWYFAIAVLTVQSARGIPSFFDGMARDAPLMAGFMWPLFLPLFALCHARLWHLHWRIS